MGRSSNWPLTGPVGRRRPAPVQVWDIYDKYILRRWGMFRPDTPVGKLTTLTEEAHPSQVEELAGPF